MLINVTQLVPSDWSIANFPAAADRMAVPAVTDPSGITMLEALVTLMAVIVLRNRMRPGNDAAVGSVSVTFVVVNRSDESVAATVYVAALMVLGDCSAMGPATCSLVVGVAVPMPTSPVAETHSLSVDAVDTASTLAAAENRPVPVRPENVSDGAAAVPGTATTSCLGTGADVITRFPVPPALATAQNTP